MQCLCRLLSAGGYARIRTKWCPSSSVCHDDSVNVFRAPPEAVLITGTGRGVCDSAWIGQDIVHDGEDAGGRQLGDTYHRGDSPSYMMEKMLDNALLRWLGRMSVTLTVDTGTARGLFNYGHRLR